MLYKLPEPFKGATHLLVEETFTDFATQVRVTGRLGTTVDDKEPWFLPDPFLLAVSRVIAGTEYAKGFRPYVNEQGAPNGNFRDVDLIVWFDKYGWKDGSIWAAQ